MLINHIKLADSDTHFAPRCFDNTIGKEVPVYVGGEQIGTGTITAVKVSADGGSAKFSVELSADTETEWNQAWTRVNRSDLATSSMVSLLTIDNI